MIKDIRKFLGFLLALACVSPAAQADDKWAFELSPYAWFAGAKGDVSTIPGSPVVPINISAKDAFDDTEASFMLAGEAMKGRHGVIFDYIYTDMQSDISLVDAIDLKLRSISRNTVYSAAYAYRIQGGEGSAVDVFAGVRYWDIETILKFKGGLGALAGKRVDSKEDWTDPLAGIKARVALGGTRAYLAGWMALGGFDAGSDAFYDACAYLGYQWTPAFSTNLGYRVYKVDYEDGDFLYDVKNDGWIAGLSFRF